MDEHEDLKRLYRQAKKNSEDKEKLYSRNRFITNLTKKFNTAMIGAIARCEDKFGFLWGHGSDKPLTKDQKKYLELWQELRTDILNHCNNQLRACIDEASQYNMTWNKYRIDFIVKKGQ